MRELFIKGGIFMWPILLCSILALAIIIERIISFRKAKRDIEEFMEQITGALEGNPSTSETVVSGFNPETTSDNEPTTPKPEQVNKALKICESTGGPIAAVIQAGLAKYNKSMSLIERAMEKASLRQIAFLEKGLTVLATLATISPLLGFLGTVSGMISSFSVIAESATREPQKVALGISEALITTASGLLVAIPILIAYNIFISIIGRFTLDMEESSGTLLEILTEFNFLDKESSSNPT